MISAQNMIVSSTFLNMRFGLLQDPQEPQIRWIALLALLDNLQLFHGTIHGRCLCQNHFDDKSLDMSLTTILDLVN